MIVNAKSSKKTNVCPHPKYKFYLTTARPGTEEKTFMKAPERLRNYFNWPKVAMICHHCLYKTDQDPEHIELLGYPLPIKKAPQNNIKSFQGRSYLLRGDITYS